MTTPVIETLAELEALIEQRDIPPEIAERMRHDFQQMQRSVRKQRVVFRKQNGQTTTLTPPLHPACRCALGLVFVEPDLQPKPETMPAPEPAIGEPVFDRAKAKRETKTWAKNLDPEQQAAMDNWVSMSGYNDIRDAQIRGLTRGPKAKAARAVESALETAPKWEAPMYRGMRFNGEEGRAFINTVVQDGGLELDAMASWSQQQTVARRFGIWDDITDWGDDAYSVVVEAKSKTGRMGSEPFRAALSGVDDEKEIISMIGSKYRYLSHEIKDVKEFGEVVAHRVKMVVEEI